MKRILTLTVLLFLLCSQVRAANHNIVATDTTITMAFDGGLTAGDTLTITENRTSLLTLNSILGASGNVITLQNASGVINTLVDATAINGSLCLDDCQYVKIDGTNGLVEGTDYGLEITGGKRGLRILGDTEDLEITGLYIHDTSQYAGIGMNEDTGTRKTMSNIYIHHSKFKDISREGMYLGAGWLVAGTTHELENLRVEYCVFESTGWEAIQYSGVRHGTNIIKNNSITDSGTADYDTSQNHGIVINIGTRYTTISNTEIYNVDGVGIYINSSGATTAYNNIVHNAGTGSYAKYGIKIESNASSSLIYNNTIAVTADDGIYLNGDSSTLRDNIICGYTNEAIDNNSAGSTLTNNRASAACADQNFTHLATDDFSLTATSPAVDSPDSSSAPATDIIGAARPQGVYDDQGAYEYSGTRNYTVATTVTTVDGDTFCGGRACNTADTITILGGARGDLVLKDFNGSSSYITIQNEDSATRVVMTRSDSNNWGVLNINNCKYIDVKGDNRTGVTYGIKVIDDGVPADASGAVWIYNDCDNIKISYLEIAYDGSTLTKGSGIKISGDELDENTVYDTIEIHNNYIHDSKYAGMYLGNGIVTRPTLANILVHDNLIEDCGSYGITLKGIKSTSGVCEIYNNTIQGSSRGQSTGLVDVVDRVGSAWFGIGVQYFYGSTYAEIYNNWIEKTKGPGIKVGDQNHLVYNNVIVGCGSGDETDWGHGIITYQSLSNGEIYQNTIIKATRYGVYAQNATISAELRDNLIAECGLDEWAEYASGDITEAASPGDNTYDASASNMNFTTWSDDGDYSNDNFSLTSTSPAVGAGGDNFPADDYVGMPRPQGTAADDGAYELPQAENDFDELHCSAVYNFESGALTTDSQGTNTWLAGTAPSVDSVNYKQGSASALFALSSSQYYYITDGGLDAGYPLKSGDTVKTISVCGWVKLTSNATTNVLYSRFDSGATKRTFMVTPNAYTFNNKPLMWIGYNSGVDSEKIDWHSSNAAVSISTGTWYHMTFSFKNSDRSYAIRVRASDGSVVGTDHTGTATNNIYVSDSRAAVGCFYGGASTPTWLFNGNIDEMVLFNRFLTAQDSTKIALATYKYRKKVIIVN